MITELTPDIYRLQVPFSNIYTSIFLIRTPEGTVVYDTATYPTDCTKYLAPALQELKLQKLFRVVISHNHGDHAGGLPGFFELYPDVPICAGSEACGERVNAPVQVLKEGDGVGSVLTAVEIPGHTADAIGLYDTRTKTLISGDCLQAYGIYGKGKWGTSIPLHEAHRAALSRLEAMDIQALYAAHHYEPHGNGAQGAEAVKAYIQSCRQALADIEAYVAAHGDMTPEELSDSYGQSTGLPTPPAKSFVYNPL